MQPENKEWMAPGRALARAVSVCKPKLGGNAQTRSMTTRWACEASASRSSGSVVSTVPPGSAIATTSASTAEPRRARLRSNAARRATLSGIRSITSQVFSSWFSFASRPACPWRHSTSTTDGTAAGQRPSSRNARMSAADARERSARRLTAPESRTIRGSTRPSASPAWRFAAQASSHEPARSDWAHQPQQADWTQSGRSPKAGQDGAPPLEQRSATAPRQEGGASSQDGRDRQANRPACVAYA